MDKLKYYSYTTEDIDLYFNGDRANRFSVIEQWKTEWEMLGQYVDVKLKPNELIGDVTYNIVTIAMHNKIPYIDYEFKTMSVGILRIMVRHPEDALVFALALEKDLNDK